MAKQIVTINGDKYKFNSKKEMLKEVGKWILEDAGSSMTLRQLYYRFVALDLLENKQSQYQYLGEAIKEARISGFIDWGLIEDRTRSTDAGDWRYVEPETRFKRSFEYFKRTPSRHNYPRWEGQDDYIEVWVEKEALAGVFSDVCEDLKVVSFPNRGYTSITLLKQAANRFKSKQHKNCKILYFGDFDPSGQDIERNIKEKLNKTFDVQVAVERVALTKGQIDKFELPPQPAKSTDARYEQFIQEHGNMAVELDALPPEELKSLIRESVEDHFDQEHYEENIIPKQEEERDQIQNKIDEVINNG